MGVSFPCSTRNGIALSLTTLRVFHDYGASLRWQLCFWLARYLVQVHICLRVRNVQPGGIQFDAVPQSYVSRPLMEIS